MFPMLKQKQRWLHREEGHPGDCYRTAIACYLGMVRDSVPHFVELYGGDSENDWDSGQGVSEGIEKWLRERGMMLIEIPLGGDTAFEGMAEAVSRNWLGGIPRLIIGGKSPRGYSHVIVWDKDEGYWDPAKNYDGGDMLVGPQTDGLWWIIAIVPSWESRGHFLDRPQLAEEC